MANVLVQDSSLTAVGNAIREKNGSITLYKPAEMAAAIQALGGGGELKLLNISFSDGKVQNNDFPDVGVDFFLVFRVFNTAFSQSGFFSSYYRASDGEWTNILNGGYSQYTPEKKDISYDVATKTFTIDLSNKTDWRFISGDIVFYG